MLAIDKQNINIIRNIIAHKANLNVITKDGFTPIMLATITDDKIIVEIVLKGTNSIILNTETAGIFPIMVAINNKNSDIVKSFIDYKANLNIKTQNGFTPVMVSISEQNDHITKLLLDAGAETNIITPNGITPHLIFIHLNQHKIFKIILDLPENGNLESKDAYILNSIIQNTNYKFCSDCASFIFKSWISSPITKFNLGTLTGAGPVSVAIQKIDDVLTGNNPNKSNIDYLYEAVNLDLLMKFTVSSFIFPTIITLLPESTYAGQATKIIASKFFIDDIMSGTQEYSAFTSVIHALATFIPKEYYNNYPFLVGVALSPAPHYLFKLLSHISELGYNYFFEEKTSNDTVIYQSNNSTTIESPDMCMAIEVASNNMLIDKSNNSITIESLDVCIAIELMNNNMLIGQSNNPVT